MHETRNLMMVLLLVAALVWGVAAWWIMPETTPLLLVQRMASVLMFGCLGAWLFYAFQIEDKLPDHMQAIVGGMYYGADGMTFMPTIRANDQRAELCVYYQNRYENPVEVIVHLRPPADSFIIRPGLHDVHFAFKAGGGDFGVIRQPIAVPEHLQGEVIEVQLAAAAYFPRSQGARLRKHEGMSCGSMLVDWGGSAFKSGVHEVSGEIDLKHPATLHLSMPTGVASFVTGSESWRQECLEPGVRK